MSFNFGSTSGGSGSSLFRTSNSSSTPLFGSTTSATQASGGNVFGHLGATASASGSIFGSQTSGQSTPASSAAANPSSTPLFGGGSNTGSTGGFTFGKKPEENKADSGIFNTPNKTSTPASAGQTSTLFGGTSTSGPTVASLFGSTTPATSKPDSVFSFGNQSTTPAGPPPPANSTGMGSGGLFGTSSTEPSQQIPNLFGAKSTASESQPASGPQVSGGLFGNQALQSAQGGSPIFGNLGPSAKSQAPSEGSTTPKPLFGAASQSTAAQPASSTAAPSLFSTNTASGQATKSPFAPAPGSQPSGLAASPFSFPSLDSSSSQAASAPTTTADAALKKDLLSGLRTAFNPPSTSAAAPSSNAFSVGGISALSSVPAASSATSTTATSGPSLGSTMFSGLGGTNASAPSAAAPASAPTAAAGATSTAAAAPSLGASTAGPAPPAQSRLKNKTMEEIITRWASDLTKYQKEFQAQAEKVAEWDQMLVENMQAISKLYGQAVTAERQTASVDVQLRAVENEQDELAGWLDRYEGLVDEMMAKQVGQQDALQGPDQERERTYKLAEKLSDRLDDMGKDLSSMIEEINSTSATLSKTTEADEPISQIVRVLNAHLTQLQAIDEGTAALQARIEAAQQTSRSLGLNNSHNGAGGGAVDDFYRSYMGRR